VGKGEPAVAQIVYLNGELVPRDEARISALDRGFLYGYGLFETVRSYGGRVFRLDRHLDRLMHSAEDLGLASQLDPVELERAIYRAMEANETPDARIRLTIGAGEGERELSPPTSGEVTTMVVVEKLTVPSRLYEEGVTAATVNTRRNSQSPLPAIKSLNYLEGLIAHAEAAALGADEAIMLNDRGFLSEGSSSNLFLVVTGKLLTPSLDSGILPGVTREAVLELAHGLGIEAVQGEIPPSELLRAEEVFLTTSVREVLPVVVVDGEAVGEGRPGPTGRRLLAGYRELVQREMGVHRG
jgi:branched-chain amino acid aminotransferase